MNPSGSTEPAEENTTSRGACPDAWSTVAAANGGRLVGSPPPPLGGGAHAAATSATLATTGTIKARTSFMDLPPEFAQQSLCLATELA
jgi:hypothetical protein